MAGTLSYLDTSTQPVTITVTPQFAPLGGHAAATFLWNITAITGTWDVTLAFTVGGQSITIATLAGKTATGLFRIPLAADFNATRMAIPGPTSITYNEAVAGTLTSSVIAIYGD